MSSREWKALYRTIRLVNRSIPRQGRRPLYPDTLIVAMYLWAVAHDRPLCWAVDRSNYTTVFRPRRLPSRSQFCRRIKSTRCQRLLMAVHDRLSESDRSAAIRYLDGRAMTVGRYTTDPDAALGYAAHRFAKGYRLHALATEDGRFTHFSVEPLNVAEQKVARELIAQAPPSALILADQGYDSRALYDFAFRHGSLLFTPLPENAGGGHHPYCWPRMLAKRWWAHGGSWLYKRRNNVERLFGQLSAFGGGLAPLPAWVRTLGRVRRWITAKLVIYHARLQARNQAA